MNQSAQLPGPGFRRRILIEPAQAQVRAELEDDWHRMVVTVEHDGSTATMVTGEMVRWPWTACPGAIARLAETFAGVLLADFPRRGEKPSNCTHLHDLAVFAAAHAAEAVPVVYDVAVSDPIDDLREARLARDGKVTLVWTLNGATFVGPHELAGLTLYGLGAWVATLVPAQQEAARILRWAAILAPGRGMALDAGMSASIFPSGSCFTFQPDIARESTRRGGADVDFSGRQAIGPLAEHARLFPPPR